MNGNSTVDPRVYADNFTSNWRRASVFKALTVFPFIIWFLSRVYGWTCEKVLFVGMIANIYNEAFTTIFIRVPRGLDGYQNCPAGDIPCYFKTLTRDLPCVTGENLDEEKLKAEDPKAWACTPKPLTAGATKTATTTT